jgi:uncharacterized protein
MLSSLPIVPAPSPPRSLALHLCARHPLPIRRRLHLLPLQIRHPIYIWNILAAWTLTITAVWLIFRNNLTLAAFGQNPGTYPRSLMVSAALFALVLALFLVNKLQKRKRNPEQIAKAVAGARKLLPVTQTERLLWIVVALTAGFCEEFLYRGWLLNVTGAALHSVWLGLLVSSICFGFAHLYQGQSGMLSTGVLGAVFGLIYMASHTLLPGQILHALLDLNNGLAFGRAAARSEQKTEG